MAAAQDTSIDQTALFRQLDNYSWNEDNEFQGGLQAILGSVQNPEQVEHLTLRAKCYYYARRAGTTIDFDAYKRWTEQQRLGANGVEGSVEAPALNGNASGGIAEAPKPASFAQIVELITEGKPIPGIKDIPDTILEGQASESQAERRRKPWERTASAEEQPSWLT